MLFLLDPDEALPKDCFEVQQKVHNRSGIYRIRLMYSTKPIIAYCDMDTDGGGWTVKKFKLTHK